MEGTSNGGLLYHEVQESKLCAVHCVNTVLQGPFFSEFDLAALASDLDHKELQMMLQGGTTNTSGNFLSEESHNVSLEGDFSIQVLQKALEVWDLQVIPFDCPVAEAAQIDPEMENAFICHLHNHWFCIRKVNGGWYNFDSLYAAPQNLSKFYLSAYLDTLRGSGWSIFLVRGNFPKECPILSSETSNGYGQWLTPEDADRINKSCNSTQAPPQGINPVQRDDPPIKFGAAGMFSDAEDEDLKAAIAASLMDSTPPTASASSTPPTAGAGTTPATAGADTTPATAGAYTTTATAGAGATPATACAGATPATACAGATPATASTGTTPQDENENSTTPQGENQSSEDKIAKE